LGIRRRRQRVGLPPDARQRVGMDCGLVQSLPGIRTRSVQGIFGAVVRQPQGIARRLFCDECCAAAHDVAELLYARPARRVRRLSDVCRMKRIVSADNARFKALLKLAESSRERKKHGLSVLDGTHLVAAYREHVGLPRELVISDTGASNPEVATLVATMAPVAPLVLSDALFHQLSTVATPTGVLATVETPRPPVAPAHIDACVMLEDIQDPGNLGSLLRSAAAAGIEHIFLSRSSVHAWSPRVLRAGMGAHFMVR